MLAAKLGQQFESLDGIATGCPDRFGVALGAEVHRLGVGFLQAIATLHIAATMRAMLHRKHVPRFMGCQFDRAL